MPTPLTRAIGELHALRRDFSAPAVRRTRQLVGQLRHLTPTSASALVSWHDELLFLVAFPKSREISVAAGRLLRRTAALVRALPRGQRSRLDDTGMAGTRTSHTFMFGAARWLGQHAGAYLPAQDAASWARAESLIRQLMLPVEGDAFDEGGLSTDAWIAQASQRARGPLRWLTSVATPATEQLWDDAELRVAWEIGPSRSATSMLRAPGSPPSRRAPFRALTNEPSRVPGAAGPPVRRLDPAEAGAWIAAAQGALVARCREVVPTLYANPRDTWLGDLGEGAAVCIIGADRAHRLALEANYGYVLFSCGVPVGYGGVTPLANQANTGINIFDAFRHSEAPFLFARCLRAFHRLFGVQHFVVNPYQFGADNDEALASGAWWFYERLGFRPSDPSALALATRERARRRTRPEYRSPESVLRRLAQHDLVLTLGTPTHPLVPESLLPRVGLLASRVLAHLTPAERPVWLAERAAWWKRRLTVGSSPPTAREQSGFQLLGPVIEGIAPRLRHWSVGDRRQLWGLVAAKGQPGEVGAARLARAHGAFWRAVRAAAGT